MNICADTTEFSRTEFQRNRSARDLPGRAEIPRPVSSDFFHQELIPEVKRAAMELNATHSILHANCVLFPNEQSPRSIELVLAPPWAKLETYISFRIDPGDFAAQGISWFTSDNPIYKRIEEPQLAVVEDLIVKFIGTVFHRTHATENSFCPEFQP